MVSVTAASTRLVYQSIRSLFSISSWKLGGSLNSSPRIPTSVVVRPVPDRPNPEKDIKTGKGENIPKNTSSHPISQSLPPSTRISSWTLPSFDPPRTAGRKSPSRTFFSSIPRRTGSAMPYIRRSVSIFIASCVARHASRRASSGWVDTGAGIVRAAADGGPQGAGRVRLSRRVSGRPGAEGAPLDG